MNRCRRDKMERQGFALVATMSIIVLVMITAMAFLGLSISVTREVSHGKHMQIARANAKMALMIALGKLQCHLGPDQRVSALAAILEKPGVAGEEVILPNRHWVGVWDTVYMDASGNSWPVIGKKPDLENEVRGAPYLYRGIYNDLRYSGSVAQLHGGRWRSASGLHRAWLVSGVGDLDPAVKLTEADGIELVGRGSLGNTLTDKEFAKRRVMVPRVTVRDEEGRESTYAFYIADNNLKASIVGDLDASKLSQASVSLLDNPGAVLDFRGNAPYDKFVKDGEVGAGKVMTRASISLAAPSHVSSSALHQATKGNFHDFTVFSPGLFTDPVLGGFKKDLTPLIFGMRRSANVSFRPPNSQLAKFPFSSDYPIIPGRRRAVLGPSFAALRHWGKQKYLPRLKNREIKAQVNYSSQSATRKLPAHGWPAGKNDGVGFEGASWASSAPKIHPVMTESRWHYYFSHTETSGGGSLRSHIFPRVCLWNPYNVRMKMPPMIVLMANPLARKSNNFAFHLSAAERQRIMSLPQFANTEVVKWCQDKFTARSSAKSGKPGLFPDTSWLGFLLEPTVFEPGQCLVFSPKIRNPDLTAGGVNISHYNKDDVSQNVLSATSPPGQDHFYHDYQIGQVRVKILDPTSTNSERKRDVWLGEDFLKEIDLSAVYKYEPWGLFVDSFVHSLKSVNGLVAVSVDHVRESVNYPTLQRISNGNAGASSYNFWYFTYWWGDSIAASGGQFGDLSDFLETPQKDAPALHQFGVKLAYLDESMTEANNPPLRIRHWRSDHVAFNPVIIGNYNVRPHLVARSPCCPVARDWGISTNGAWMTSFAPLSPKDPEDLPFLSASGKFSKHPMGRALQFSNISNAAMFDLPDVRFGALSLAALRHAQLSPYSWHPTYIVGSSLADIHATYEFSANPLLERRYLASDGTQNSFEYYLGGCSPHHLTWGARVWSIEAGSLLQLDRYRTGKDLNGVFVDSEDEILTYDIAFEVNQNLWDQYFLSSVPMSHSGNRYSWYPRKMEPLWNDRYAYNFGGQRRLSSFEKRLNKSGLAGLSYGFWNNGYYLKNKAAFNVNSTSVDAWTAFLSGLRDRVCAAQMGSIGGEARSVFSRLRVPLNGEGSSACEPTSQAAWAGARVLTDAEIRLLAKCIVYEVKSRGPFLSLADFVNRRLAPKAVHGSSQGAIEAAIARSGVNKQLETPLFRRSLNSVNDNNHVEFRVDYDKQPASKNWGIPSHIIQSDILQPLAPAMTVRGDTFTVRCVGESVENGKVMARAYLEVIVCRSPEYVAHVDVNVRSVPEGKNRPTDPALNIDRVSSEVTAGDLSSVNAKFGRKFRVQSMKWLDKQEI